MNGEAKRDYPASIGYQSAWYRQYHHVEDHFARLNTVLTRGTPDVRVAVIHPIESFWMFTGPNDKTGARRAYLNQQFVAVTNSLVFGGVDFDFISEALLPQLCETASNPLKVGAMSYSCVIVPMVETLRSTTLERLNAFTKAGGRVIILGRPPRFVDARPSDEAVKAAENWNILNVDYTALLEALEPERFVNFINEATGYRCGNILYQLRQDTDGKWLFFCHGENIEKQPGIKPVTWSEKTCVTIKGDWDITEYNTMTGEIYRPAYEVKRGNTLFRRTLFAQDSVLLHLSPSTKGDRVEPGNMPYRPMPYGMQDTILKRSSLKSASSGKALKPADPVPYSLDEPNALILDKARFAFDGEAYSSDEMDCFLIADEGRKRFYENHQEQRIVQPWVPIPEELKNSPDHTVSRLFSVDSDIWVENAHLALEDSEEAVILVNGKEISNASDGWYVDRCIHTVPAAAAGQTTVKSGSLSACGLAEWCGILALWRQCDRPVCQIVKRAESN